jgi:hypothetical protein
MRVKVDLCSGFNEAQTYATFPYRTDAIDVGMGTYRRGLSQELIEAGDDHGKHARMMWVWMRVKAPRYWWQEMATYSVGISTISESTMHTLTGIMRDSNDAKDIFHLFADITPKNTMYAFFHDAKRASDIEEMKAALPEGFLQTRGINVNYQTLRRIFHARKSHRLKTWHSFLRQTLQQVPYPEWITAPDDPEEWLE